MKTLDLKTSRVSTSEPLTNPFPADVHFLKFRDECRCALSPPPRFINPGKNLGWYEHVCAKIDTVPEQGLYFTSNTLVSGHSYCYIASSFLIDGSEPNRTAQRFAKDDELQGRDPSRPKNIRVIDVPALVVAGPGYPIWGHWLLDFLPRLALAGSILGRDLDDLIIPLPADTPKWVFRFLKFFCGLSESRVVTYDRATEGLLFARAIHPTFCHDNGLHPIVSEMYKVFSPNADIDSPRNICLTRRFLGPKTRSAIREFEDREAFESKAEKFGFTLVAPETMSFRQQISLFAGAHRIVGEHGSGMHTALFAQEGTVVGTIGMLNACQQRISNLCQHRPVYLFLDSESKDSEGILHMSVRSECIEQFLSAVIDA